MVLSDPLNPNSLYRLDLTTGKVVDEWKISDNLSVNNFIPDSKYAQTTQQQTFIGTSHNALFRIDPRLAGDKLVNSEYKQYVSKNDFSAATTTESGKLAVASNKGEIRLFDSIGKNAKTALPGLGEAVRGVDVTADGRYVIATCKTYLLFIDTKITEGRYAGHSGCKAQHDRLIGALLTLCHCSRPQLPSRRQAHTAAPHTQTGTSRLCGRGPRFHSCQVSL